MNAYTYIGVDRSGKRSVGKMMARDEANLEEMLKAEGLWLITAKTLKDATRASTSAGPGSRFNMSGSKKRRELINFATLMSFLLKVGIPLVQALDHAAADCDNPKFKGMLYDLKRQVESGHSFHETMEKYPNMFSAQFVSLVRAGEGAGNLPETFIELKRYLEWQESIISDVRQATIYPAIVLIVVILFVLLLFTFVVPKFAMLLTAVKVDLPLPTRMVFGFSDFIKATWWIWFGAIVLIPSAIRIGVKMSPAFAIGVDRVKFKLPLFGSLNHMLAMARFCHNLALLYRSGVIILESLKLCQGLVGSPLVSRSLGEARGRIEAGDSLSEALKKHNEFTPLLLRMVAMGEKTGTLDTALENVSGYYNILIPRRIKKIFSVVEPALILFLVAIVGIVAIAVFLPIITLMGSIK